MRSRFVALTARVMASAQAVLSSNKEALATSSPKRSFCVFKEKVGSKNVETFIRKGKKKQPQAKMNPRNRTLVDTCIRTEQQNR
jgi:hypothetical protein